MATVGITAKAGQEILTALSQYKAVLDNKVTWMQSTKSELGKAIKGSQTLNATYQTMYNAVNNFFATSKQYYSYWNDEITGKMEAYKKNDTTTAQNMSGKKS